MRLSDNALAVLRRRYLKRGPDGEPVEQWHDLVQRVAEAIAVAEGAYGATRAEVREIRDRFAGRMLRLEFLPNSPTLMNAGRPLGQLAACFVVPVEDHTADIFAAVGWAAVIQKTGGGTGFSFSRLRPSGDRVESTGGVASGPVAFMDVFNVATEAIKQGGVRRGANMGMLRVDHPDILDFITLKLDPARMQNFNLSVAVTDQFMEAALTGDRFDLIHPRGGVVRSLEAQRVFDLMVNAAWDVGDPGVVFIDRVNASHPTPALGPIEATNPCGEQPLLAFESCTLGSINLGLFAAGGTLDVPRLTEAVHDAVCFLDDVIDVNRYPLPQIEAATRATRKIGLGVMGFADMLVELGVSYASDRALELADEVARLIEQESVRASSRLAELRGTFPAYEGSTWAERGIPMRNATTTTIAPTGTLSIIADCSSGIEPMYALAYQRRVLDGEVLTEVNTRFRKRAEEQGVWSDALHDALVRRGGAQAMSGVPESLRQLFVTAHDVPVDQHVRMQSVFQRHVHAAVSKTINLPTDACPNDVAHAFVAAYRHGCKGVTVYRDGARRGQVLAFGATGQVSDTRSNLCPACTEPTTHRGRCDVCSSCGWSACS